MPTKSLGRWPRGLRFLVFWPSFLVLNWRPPIKGFALLTPFKAIHDYGKNQRGMSFWQDLVDWVGD